MRVDLADYFRGKRSIYQNAIITLTVGFILSFSAYLILDATRTYLGMISMIFLIGNIIMYLFNKDRELEEWENYSLIADSDEEIKKEIKQKNRFPSTYKRIPRDYLRAITPTNIWILGVQCIFWGSMIVIFILWNNPFTKMIKTPLLSTLYNFFKPILELTRTGKENDLTGIGPRHILFGIIFFFSAVFMCIDLYLDKISMYLERRKSCSLILSVFFGCYIVLWSSVMYLVNKNSPGSIDLSIGCILWGIEIFLFIFLIVPSWFLIPKEKIKTSLDNFLMSINRSPFHEMRTYLIPFFFFIIQIIVMILLTVLPVETPSQILDKTYFEHLWESVFLIPLVEELLYRIIGIGAFTMFILSLIGEGNISQKLKRGFLNTLDMSKQGVRFPYRLDLTDKEDLSYTLLLSIMSIVFGFTHVWGYGINKLIPTILMGFLLGGLFLRYGASSCILYHMLHNWILVTGTFFFPECGFIIHIGVIPFMILIWVLFYECNFPINQSLINDLEEEG